MVNEEVPPAPLVSPGQHCHPQQGDRGVEQRKRGRVQDDRDVVCIWQNWVLVALLTLVSAMQLVTEESTRVKSQLLCCLPGLTL